MKTAEVKSRRQNSRTTITRSKTMSSREANKHMSGIDFRKKPEMVKPGQYCVIRRGINTSYNVIGKISAVYSRGVEFYCEGWYMAEWKDVLRVFEPKDSRMAHDLDAAVAQLAKEDAEAAKAKSDMKTGRVDGEDDTIEEIVEEND